MRDCSLAEFLQEVASGWNINLTNVQALDNLLSSNLPDVSNLRESILTLSTNVAALKTDVAHLKTVCEAINNDLITAENLTTLRDNVKSDSEDLFEDYIQDKLQLKLKDLKDLLNTINGSLGTKLAEIDSSIESINSNVNSSINQLQEATEGLETEIGVVKNDLKAAVDQTEQSLSDVISAQQQSLTEILANLKSGVMDAVSATRNALTSSLSEINAEIQGCVSNMKNAVTGAVSETKESLENLVDGVDEECVNIIAKLNGLVSEIESSTTVKDIQIKVSSFYECYGELVSKLNLLQAQCVVTYKEWMQQAEIASAQKLEIADQIDSIEAKISALKEHEQSLSFICSQFDKLNLIATTINTLNRNWEADHATIEKFNSIVESQQTYDKSKLAANVGVLLTGVSDALKVAQNEKAAKKAVW